MRSLLKGEYVKDEEMKIVLDDGSLLFLLVSSSMETVATGKFLHALFKDITGQRELEKVLRDTEKRSRVALDSAQIGTFDYNVVTGEIAWDANMRRMWDVGENEKLDYARLIECIHPDDRARLRQSVRESLTPGANGRYEGEYRIIWDDGSVHWTLGKGQVYFQGEGKQRKAVRMIGVQIDVTERKRIEEELRRSRDELEQRVEDRTVELRDAYDKLIEETKQRQQIEERLAQSQKMEAVGTLAGGIAHDFNNMLAVIMGNAELAHDEVGNSMNGIGHQLDQILKASRRASDLVKQILAFSRKQQGAKRPFSLIPLVKETAKMLTRHAAQHHRDQGRCRNRL